MGGAGGDKDAFAAQRAVPKLAFDGGHDLQRLGHAPGTIFAAGHVSFVRANRRNAIATQGRDVAPGCGMLPHAHIHRWCNQDRRIGRQQQRRGQIIRAALRHLGHKAIPPPIIKRIRLPLSIACVLTVPPVS